MLGAVRPPAPITHQLAFLLFVAVLPQAFFPFVRRHFVALTFPSTGHSASEDGW